MFPALAQSTIDTPAFQRQAHRVVRNVEPTLQAGNITGSSGASRQAVNVQVAVSSDTGGFVIIMQSVVERCYHKLGQIALS